MTHRVLILNHLERGKDLTALGALNLFGCLRLAARIAELRDMGYHIERTLVVKGMKRWARYRMGQRKRPTK